jgi:hypothetical protein
MTYKINNKLKLAVSTIIALVIVALTVNWVVGQIGGGAGNLNKGLIGHWTMDQADLKSATVIADRTPNGNNGTIYGATFTTDRREQANKAMNFNGIDDYVAVNNDGWLPTTALSWGVWIKTPDFTNTQRIFLGEYATGTKGFNVYIRNSSHEVEFILGNGTTIQSLAADTATVADTWEHWVGTYNGTTMKMYCNGVEQATTANLSGPIVYFGSGGFVISQASLPFNGSIDDVRIYNRALSPAEVTQLYDLGGGEQIMSTGTKNKGLVSYWALDEKSEKLGTDLVTNGSFTTDTTGWNVVNSAVLSSEAGGQSGNCLKLLNGAAAYGYAHNGCTTTIAGKTYSVNYWHKNGTSDPSRIAVGTTSALSDLYDSGSVLSDTDWTERRFSFTATTTASCIRLINGSAVDGQYTYFDEIKLAEVQTADKTPYANHGAIYGASVRNQGAEFNGTSDYINAGDLTAFEFAGDFTVSAWIKYITYADQVFVSKWSGVGSGSQWWLGYISAGTSKIQFGVYTASKVAVALGTSITSGTWRHVVGVRSGTNIYIYEDGVQKGTDTTYAEVAGQNSAPLTIGNYNGGAGSWWDKGNIADVLIYNRALSASEVLNLYQGNDVAGAILDMPLDTGFKDLSGNGYNGTNYGADIIGQAADFDGTNDLMEIADSNSLDMGTSNFSISTWLNPDTGILRIWKAPDDGNGTEQGCYLLVYLSGTNYFYLGDGTSHEFSFAPSAYPQQNQWNHVTLVIDRDNDKYYQYLNGVDVTSGGVNISSVTGSLASTGKLYIQAFRSGSWYYSNGTINDFRIYNRALSTTEITDLYNLSRREQVISMGSLNKGLVGQWALDSTHYNSTTSRVDDLTPYGNHGTNYGATVGSDYTTFDGSNDYVEVADNAVLNITGDITLSAWVYRNSIGSEDDIIVRGQHVVSGWRVFISGVNDIRYSTYQSGFFQETHSSNTIAAGQWFHIVATRTGATGKLYLNGAECSYSQQNSHINPTAVNRALRIGAYGDGTSPFDGRVDDVRVYNRALSATEIQTLYANGRN